MPAPAVNSGAASSAESYGFLKRAHPSSHLRQRFRAPAEIAARMRIAQPRDAHVIDEARGFAEFLPLADARFLFFPGRPIFRRPGPFRSSGLRAARIDRRLRADCRTVGAALAAA